MPFLTRGVYELFSEDGVFYARGTGGYERGTPLRIGLSFLTTS